MKKILLISNKVMHYRSSIYNEFYKMFAEMGYEFHVVSNEYQTVGFDIVYKKHELPFSSKEYAKFIDELKPDVCINFLHLKDKMIIPLTLHCRRKGIPMIYWNHGINKNTPNAHLKNLIYHFVHRISNAIILYSDNELKYLWEGDRKKTFIAKNTLSFAREDAETIEAPDVIKAKYDIKEKYVIMYISRILPYKGLDVLLDNFSDVDNLAVVVVGAGLSEEQRKKIDSCPHYYYLGEMYEKEVDEIYSIGDIFSTPGHIGLAVNQAMYWGKPIVLLKHYSKMQHAPEICYLKNNVNGWLLDDVKELKETVIRLISDEKLLKNASKAARETYENEMQISDMFKGFRDAVNYVVSNNK